MLKQARRADFAVIDPVFPQKEPFAFRNSEINEYLRKIKNSHSFAMYPMKPGPEAWFSHGYGVSDEAFKENLKGYLKHYPFNKGKISHLRAGAHYKFGLAYSFFLAETYTLLPFYEENKIPFVFVLYPGGGFGLGNKSSDKMLIKIFNSKWFREVIVTQEITRSYLIEQSLCPPEKISYIYGGFVQFNPNDIKPKVLFPKAKKTFDICFVAAKYTPQGVDKGYDLFIEIANILSQCTTNINFHIVGGFGPDDIEVAQLGNRIKFYGYLGPKDLLELYSTMDIFLAPNRPFKIFEGNFDGFPLGIDAAYCGTALLVADELKMNQFYTDGRDIVLIPLNSSKVSETILGYYKNPDSLYELSERCQATTQKLFDINHQINERIKVFGKYVDLKMQAKL